MNLICFTCLVKKKLNAGTVVPVLGFYLRLFYFIRQKGKHSNEIFIRAHFRFFMVLIWLCVYLSVDQFISMSCVLGLEEQCPNNLVQGSRSIFNDPRSTSLCTRPELSKSGIIPGSNYKADALLHTFELRAWEIKGVRMSKYICSLKKSLRGWTNCKTSLT